MQYSLLTACYKIDLHLTIKERDETIDMKQALAFFTTDVKWKLLSLALAFVLWFISANFNDPSTTRTYHLPLQIQNVNILANQGLIIVDEYPLDTHVRLGVRASRSVLDYLSEIDISAQLEHITPTIDFGAISAEDIYEHDGIMTVRLDISANLDWYKGLELFSIHPRFVYVEMDVIERAVFPVSIDILNEVAPGLELRPIQLANNSVAVTASRTILSRVSHVQVNIDVVGIHSVETLQNLPLIVICHEGTDITELVQLSVTETTANVPVLNVSKVELRVKTTGNIATNFAIANITLYPMEINVIGSPELLDELEYIEITHYIDGINSDQTFTVGILELLPPGVFLSSGESPNVQMRILVEPIERRIFHIPRDNVRIRGIAAIYQILGDQQLIRVDVSGPRSIVNELDYSDIGLELDLRNRQIGVHNVALAVYLPDEISLAMNAPLLQVQIHEPATESDDDDYDHYYIDDELQEPQYPEFPSEYDENGESTGSTNDEE